MRRNEFSKRFFAAAMAAAMTVSGLPSVGYAAEEKDSGEVFYFVDCGDFVTNTVCSGDAMGSCNSVTDQVFGKDPKTDYEWGIVDTVSDPLKNGSSNKGGVDTDHTWAYESNAANKDVASKTDSNRYTKNQYEQGIEVRYMDYKFQLKAGEYTVETCVADPWNCSQSPSFFVDTTGKSAEEISDGFKNDKGLVLTPGTPEKQNVKLDKDGYLTVSFRATGDANKAINVNYIKITDQMAGEALLKADKEALSLEKEVTGDLVLPAIGAEGKSSITWKSSDPAHITDEGKVTRPGVGEKDAEVTLTATLKNGDLTDTKEFTVTVIAMNAMMGLSYFGNDEVEVTDAFYDNALELDVTNLLKLDADRLLAGFRETAAYAYKSKNGEFPEGKTVNELMKGKARYGGGWEDSLIGGHTLGHYLTAVAQGIVNPGTSAEEKTALTERLNTLVSALKECQEWTQGTDYEGYLFGATLPNDSFKNDVDLQFDNIDQGKANIGNQAWVPWYTMHKILTGLNDSYTLAGNEQALAVANGLATWIANRVNQWDDTKKYKVLSIEYGGMNDCLYETYKINKKLADKKDAKAAENYEDFKTAAHMFDEDTLFQKVYKGGSNILNGRHANTTIPKFLGALNGYEADSSKGAYLDYVKAFWDMVVNNHTYITGGNSEDEHFGADNILDKERTVCNNETCNTNNMLKLSRKLFAITGEKKYADYYERTLINAIMASQDHKTGMTMYFQPMATGFHKVYSTLDDSFWCCTGTGMENFTKLQDSVYFKGNGNVIVNQYLQSVVKQDGYQIEQTGDLMKDNTMKFKVTSKKDNGVDFDLRLRIPDWAAGKIVVAFGNDNYEYTERDGYIVIENSKIKNGAEFTVTLPMQVTAENLPDGANTYGFMYGPYVLSAKLGTSKQGTTSHGVRLSVPNKKAVSSDDLGILSEASVEDFIAKINHYMVKDGENMSFTLNGVDQSYTFIPHYLQDESYGIYWKYFVDENGRGAKAVIDEKNQNRINRTMLSEMLQAGRGQYENQFTDKDGKAFGFVDEKGDSAADTTNLTRQAAKGSSFGYYMAAAKGEDNYLYVTFAKEDNGKPAAITIGDSVIFEGKLDSTKAEVVNLTLPDTDQEAYYQVAFKVSKDIIEKNAKSYEVKDGDQVVKKDLVLVKFAGTADEESARICKSVLMMKGFADTNKITKITGNGKELTAKDGVYEMKVSYTDTPEIKIDLADSRGYVAVDEVAIDEKAARKLTMDGAETTFKLKVYAENFKAVEEVSLKVTLDYTGLSDQLKNNLVKKFGFEDNTDGAVAVTNPNQPNVLPEKSDAEYEYTDGKNKKSIKLDGSYGLKLMDDTAALGKDYTITFWMKPTKLGGSVDPLIAGGTFAPEYWLNMTCDAKIWSHNSGYVATPAANAYKNGKWQQVTLTVDGDTEGSTANTVFGTLYIDGEKVSEGDVASDIMLQDQSMLYFGINKWDHIYSGEVDDILIFNKTLTAAEVGGVSANAVNAGTMEEGGNTGENGGNSGTGGNGGNGGNTGGNSDNTGGNGGNTGGNGDNAGGNGGNTGGNGGNSGTGGNSGSTGGNSGSNTNSGKTTTDTSSANTTANSTVGNTVTVNDKKAQLTYTVSGNTVTLKTVKNASGNVVIPKTITCKTGTTSKIVTVTAIADNAFKNNTKIKKVTISDTIVSIGKNAFAGCKKITGVTIGKKVKSIGKNAFKGCKKLKTITIKGNITKIGKGAFASIKKNAAIKIKANKKKYKKIVKLIRKSGAKKVKCKRI